MILIVDDDAEVLDIVSERLEMGGRAVLRASGAEQALQLVAARPELRLMVTDVRMAGMSGLDLAEVAVRKRPDLRVILISGYFHAQTINMRFLQKPFTFAELDAAIRAELDG